MSAALEPLTLVEFLAWERTQPERYEFDGVQPVALANRIRPPCEAFGPDLKVLTTGRIRYPDASVVCGASDDQSDLVEPAVVFEVLSPSTALTDRRVKALEYAAAPSIRVYVRLEQDRPEITVMRRARGWEAETIQGLAATLDLAEIDINLDLNTIYAA